jgi:hypothetical protein
MCITGRIISDPIELSDEVWNAMILRRAPGSLYEDGQREECNHPDIVMVTIHLTQFVKAHADVLMGRGGNGTLLTR